MNVQLKIIRIIVTTGEKNRTSLVLSGVSANGATFTTGMKSGGEETRRVKKKIDVCKQELFTRRR